MFCSQVDGSLATTALVAAPVFSMSRRVTSARADATGTGGAHQAAGASVVRREQPRHAAGQVGADAKVGVGAGRRKGVGPGRSGSRGRAASALSGQQRRHGVEVVLAQYALKLQAIAGDRGQGGSGEVH